MTGSSYFVNVRSFSVHVFFVMKMEGVIGKEKHTDGQTE